MANSNNYIWALIVAVIYTVNHNAFVLSLSRTNPSSSQSDVGRSLLASAGNYNDLSSLEEENVSNDNDYMTSYNSEKPDYDYDYVDDRLRYFQQHPLKLLNRRKRILYDPDRGKPCYPTKQEVFNLLVVLQDQSHGNPVNRTLRFCKQNLDAEYIKTNIRFPG